MPTLKKGKVDKKRIYVFVANKTEEKLYREKLDPNTYHKLVVGKKGIGNQRVFISKYFPENKKIVSMDDDVQNMIQLKRDNNLKKISNLDTLFKRAFKTLDKHNLYLWGVYPVKNNMFMSHKTTTDLRFIIGVVHGYINRHSRDLYPSKKILCKEDIETSILFYLKDGGVLRFNDITSPNAINNLPDRCFLNQDEEVLCNFNNRLHNIPPKLSENNQVTQSIGKDITNSVMSDNIMSIQNNPHQVWKYDNDKVMNGGELYGNVIGSSSINEDFLQITNIPKNSVYAF